jgi:TPR repeat protein
MTIKEFAYSAQQHLEAQAGEKFKRAHIYELLAASFGYNSFAALKSESVLFQGTQASVHGLLHSDALRQRCLDLGYQTYTTDLVGTEFASFIEQERIIFVTLSTLIATLRRQLSYRGYWGWQSEDDFDQDKNLPHVVDEDWPPFDDESRQDLIPSSLLTALEIAASRADANAHYALALIHAPVDVEKRSPGFDYWYNEGKRGRVLAGVEKEWADKYAETIAYDKKYEFHLCEAGRLGNGQAQLDLAEYFGDPAFFVNTNNNGNHSPRRVAEIAESLGRIQDVYTWLTLAAETGDVEAMHRLIEEFDQDDLQRYWTWIYLAQLLEIDLTQDDYYAIHEDGSHYDDDVGGPMYVNGREGIQLSSLSEDQDSLARQRAQILFDKIQ